MRPAPVWLVLALLLLGACTASTSPPARPASVPADAMWIGGVDGGAWVLLGRNESDPAHVYRAEIYGDQAGERWYVGRLAVEPASQPGVPLDSPEAFGVWDGDALHLQDGRIMRAIDAFDPFSE